MSNRPKEPQHVMQAHRSPRPMEVRSSNNPSRDQSNVDEECITCPNFIRQCQWVWWSLLVIGVLLILILVPLSFEYIEYYEYGLKKNNVNNKVDTSRVYENGQYNWGIDFDVQSFPRGYQKEDLILSIFPSNGLEFTIEITFFWRIKKNELGQLFSKYALTYPTQLESRANSKIKNAAPQFTIEQYIRERPLITRTLHKVLSDELASIHIECPQSFFSLKSVNLPIEIKQRDLEAAVRIQLNIKQQNEQIADLVRKETERLVQVIASNTTLVGIDAKSISERLIEEAYAQGNRTIQDANSNGARSFFSTLGITDSVTKSAYIRFYALEESI